MKVRGRTGGVTVLHPVIQINSPHYCICIFCCTHLFQPHDWCKQIAVWEWSCAIIAEQDSNKISALNFLQDEYFFHALFQLILLQFHWHHRLLKFGAAGPDSWASKQIITAKALGQLDQLTLFWTSWVHWLTDACTSPCCYTCGTRTESRSWKLKPTSCR
jgi:hypothetical protein